MDITLTYIVAHWDEDVVQGRSFHGILGSNAGDLTTGGNARTGGDRAARGKCNHQHAERGRDASAHKHHCRHWYVDERLLCTRWRVSDHTMCRPLPMPLTDKYCCFLPGSSCYENSGD